MKKEEETINVNDTDDAHRTLNDDTRDLVTSPPKSVSSAMYEILPKIEITKDQEAILMAPLSDDDVCIHPGKGFTYVAHQTARRRLIRTFGATGVRLLPRGDIQSEEIEIYDKTALHYYQDFNVYLCGVPFSVVRGGSDMKANKGSTSITDIASAIRSDAFKEVLKELGGGLEVFDQTFSESFKSRCCEQVRNDKGKFVWQKKKSKIASVSIPPSSGGLDVAFKEKIGPAEHAHAPVPSEPEKFKLSSGWHSLADKVKAINEKLYYDVLGEVGVKHRSEVSDSEKAETLFARFTEITEWHDESKNNLDTHAKPKQNKHSDKVADLMKTLAKINKNLADVVTVEIETLSDKEAIVLITNSLNKAMAKKG